MSYQIQICIDAADPHTQADWWAETLGWEVEPSNADFIRSMLDKGYATEADTLVHRGVLVWRLGQAINPPNGQPGARILFQTVPELKTVKNREHLDIRVGDDDKDVVRDQLVTRGATYLNTGQIGPNSWHVMTDPEGNEFCIG